MPAEWEPHEATWIAWPHNRSDWPGKFAPIPWVYAEIVRNLARVERVNILVNNEAAEARARDVLITAEVLPKNCADPGSPQRQHQVLAHPHQSRLDARLPDRSSCGAIHARKPTLPPLAPWRGDLTPGQSTTTGSGRSGLC